MAKRQTRRRVQRKRKTQRRHHVRQRGGDWTNTYEDAYLKRKDDINPADEIYEFRTSASALLNNRDGSVYIIDEIKKGLEEKAEELNAGEIKHMNQVYYERLKPVYEGIIENIFSQYKFYITPPPSFIDKLRVPRLIKYKNGELHLLDLEEINDVIYNDFVQISLRTNKPLPRIGIDKSKRLTEIYQLLIAKKPISYGTLRDAILEDIMDFSSEKNNSYNNVTAQFAHENNIPENTNALAAAAAAKEKARIQQEFREEFTKAVQNAKNAVDAMTKRINAAHARAGIVPAGGAGGTGSSSNAEAARKRRLELRQRAIDRRRAILRGDYDESW